MAQSEPRDGCCQECQRPLTAVNRTWDKSFMTSYSGEWLVMPLDFLEVVANVCYQFPRPRFIDPSYAYDLVKVRRLVEEAASLAVRAANNAPNGKLTAVIGDTKALSMAHLHLEPHGQSTSLSPQRKLRMRRMACQKLARAYQIDENACMVAFEHIGTVLLPLADQVLQHDPDDLDALYVEAFHPKARGHTPVTSTNLDSLNRLVSANSVAPEYWRSRATEKMMTGDYEGAVSDATSGLSTYRMHLSKTVLPKVPASQPLTRVQLAEDEQPSGLRGQLLFLRGWAYLTAAFHLVRVALGLRDCTCPGCAKSGIDAKNADYKPGLDAPGKTRPGSVEAQQKVKVLAKRALRDILEFLKELDYSPNISMYTVRDFTERTAKREYGNKRTRHTERHVASRSCTVYTVADLFAARPPSDLPEKPTARSKLMLSSLEETCEMVTAHPLLEDALHQLLLCHALLQTSRKELERHAYMVARLMRLHDGQPIFRRAPSKSQGDWEQLLGRLGNWIKLSDSWGDLCTREIIVEESLKDKFPQAGMQDPWPVLATSKAAKSKKTLASNAANPHAAPVRDAASFELIVDVIQDPKIIEAASSSAPSAFRLGDDGTIPPISPQVFAIGSWIIHAPKVEGVKRKKKAGKRKGKAEDSGVVLPPDYIEKP